MDAIRFVEDQLISKTDHPSFRPGDTVVVTYKIIEGAKERNQSFKGDVIKITGAGASKMFTVRKMSNGVGVERIWPVSSPSITKIDVVKRGKVRRSKLYYLRGLVGKKARIKERQSIQK